MRKFVLIFYIFVLCCSAIGRGHNIPIDSVTHIQIDSIIVYDTPYVICNAEHENNGFKPVWNKAYDATSNPHLFHHKAHNAMPYLHKSLEIEENKLQKFYDTWVQQPDSSIDLTWYVLGDIYFHDKESSYIYSPAWGARYNIPVQLSDLNIDNLGLIDRSELDTCDMYYPFYRDDHGTFSFYILEDGNYKDCKASMIYDILQWDIKALDGTFGNAKRFLEFIKRQKTYTRSRIENGQRIFETIKNTPDGPVVVKQVDDNETPDNWLYKYWWVLAAIVLFGLLVIALKRKRS